MYTPRQYWFQWFGTSGRMLYFESAADVHKYSLQHPSHRIIYTRFAGNEVINRFYYSPAKFWSECSQL
jgi:hypothetical protein